MDNRKLLRERGGPEVAFSIPLAEFHDFSDSYRHAAGELVRSHKTGGLWAYPIIFLYRHSIELIIKELLFEHGAPDICPTCVLHRSHDLSKQLPDLEKLAEKHNLELSRHLKNLIEVWNTDDPHGMRARYPFTKNGNRDELPNGDSFDLLQFVHACEAALDELNSMREQIVLRSSYSDFVESQDKPAGPNQMRID